MPASFVIERVNALPSPLVSNTLYIERPIGSTEGILTFVGTDPSSVAKVFNRAESQIDIGTAIAEAKSVFVFDNFSALQTAVKPKVNSVGYVKNAVDDPLVKTPSALYVYEVATGAWSLLPTGGAADSIDWNKIIGRPVSTVAAIDAAVTASHAHANKATLDALGIDGQNRLTLSGTPVSPVTVKTDW